jgi:hypothetical protein
LLLSHPQKQVELRDAALADLNKATRKLQKAKKRPEAIKSQQVPNHSPTAAVGGRHAQS